jgi:hypothetical protein
MDIRVSKMKQVELRDSEYSQVPGKWEWLKT